MAASGASASTAASQPAAASGASDTHVWSGSIEAAPASAASGAALAQASSPQAAVPVSSLQQLLALKNRVLMALQKHGIGKPAQPAAASSGAPANGGPAPNAAVGAASPAPGAAQPELSPVLLGVVAAIGVVVLLLIVRLLTRKRKKPVETADDVPPTVPDSPVAGGAVEPPVMKTAEVPAAAVAAGVPAAPAETPRETGIAPAAPQAELTPELPQLDETIDHATDAASLSAAASLGGEALPPAPFEAVEEAPQQASPEAPHTDHAAHDFPTPTHGVEPGEPETLADASEAAGFAAAAELGASALPPEGFGVQPPLGEAEELVRAAEPDLPEAAQEPTHEPAQEPQHESAQEPQHEPAQEPTHEPVQEPAAEPAPPPHVAEPDLPTLDLGTPYTAPAPELHLPGEPAHAPQPETAQPEAPPFAEPASPAVAAEGMNYAAVPPEFPQDAVSALGGIDMSLPPRVADPAAEPAASHAPLSTEPVNSPETTAAQAVPFFDPPAPPAGEAIEAGTAGPGAIAGLGAPRFGALTLDFDLNLPPDSAEPLPVFTPEQLARIARNKLELAHEYIALGDLSGARSLINEVIESNDHGTRADAQALLSTLAPLS